MDTKFKIVTCLRLKNELSSLEHLLGSAGKSILPQELTVFFYLLVVDSICTTRYEILQKLFPIIHAY